MNARAMAVLLVLGGVGACGSDAPDRPPVVSGQPLTVAEDGSGMATFAASDPDGDPITFRFSTPAHGAITGAGPTVTYTPVADFHGTDAVQATVSDGTLQATATITITVTPVNDAPVAADDTAAAAEDQPAAIAGAALTSNDTDVDGDALTVTAVSDPAHGTVALTAGTVTFTPDPDFIGAAGFTYTVSDGVATDTARVVVTVADANDPPVAVGDARTTAEDTPLAIAASSLAANDTDPEGQTLSVVAVGGEQRGTVALAGGTITFTPEADFAGAASFTYTVSDGADTAVGTVAVTVTPVPDAPVAVADARTTAEDTPLAIAASSLAANDTDADGQALTVTAVGAPIGGTVALVAGTITFTPFTNLAGSASFQYTVSDGALTATGAVAVTITPVPDAPVAAPDSATVAEDGTLTLPGAALTANDADVDGPALTVTAVALPQHGTVSVAAGVVTFVPEANYNGPASFQYTVSDGALTDTAAVAVTVTPVPDAPIAVADAISGDEDIPLTLAAGVLAANDVDPDGQVVMVTAVGGAQHGTVALAAGAITFTPEPNFAGAASFQYTASDGALTATGTVTVTLAPVNDAPVAIAQMVGTDENAAVVITLTATDLDSASVTFATAPPGQGALGPIAPAGPLAATVTYTPPPDVDGTATFTFTASDGSDTSAPATVTVAIANVPRCNDGTVDAGEGCDDQGNGAGDGCSPTCTVEAGWACSGAPSACDAGFFSEYVEGSSNNKAIEIANPFAGPMSMAGCALRIYSNGSTTPSSITNLTGTIAAGDVYLACHSAFALAAGCDFTTASMNWNGNDAIELVCNAVVLDVFGRIGENPGIEWGTGLTSTADNTLRRRCSVTTGDANGLDAFDPAIEWLGFATDTFDGLGVYGCP